MFEEQESVYARSVFRCTGVSASIPSRELAELFERWQGMAWQSLSMEELSDIIEGDLPWLVDLRPDAQDLANAQKVCSDQFARMRERAFWYHTTSDVDKKAVAAMREGRLDEALELWTAAWKDSPEYRASAAHNLAVLYHSRALANPRGSVVQKRDVKEAARWWAHIIDGGRLRTVVSEGEDLSGCNDDELFTFTNNLSAEITTMLSYMRYRVSIDDEQGASSMIVPLANGSEEYHGPKVKSHASRLAAVNIALERAVDCARLNDRQGAEAAIDAAKSEAAGQTDFDMIEKTWERLALNLITRGSSPVKQQPFLSPIPSFGTSLVGFGQVDPATRSFEASLVFRIAFLSVLSFGRYRVRQNSEGRWEFLGKLGADWRVWLLNAVFVWAAVLCILVAAQMSSMTFLPSEIEQKGYLQAGEVMLSNSDLGEYRKSRVKRFERIDEFRKRIVALQNERSNISNNTIPECEEAILGAAVLEEKLREERITEYQEKIKEAKARLTEIAKEISTVREMIECLEAMEESR